MKIEKGEVIIDIRELLEALDPKDLREVARTAAFDVEIIECLCKWISTGEVAWDGDDGIPWYIFTTSKSSVLEKAKKALMPLMGDIEKQFIAELMRDRDFYESLYEQYRNQLWHLERIWRESEYPPNFRPDYGRTYYTKEDAKKAIEAFERKIEDDKSSSLQN